MTLDRSLGVPLHEQVQDILRGWLGEGTIQPGERLPTETELAKRFGVNRLTVRQAIAELSRVGMLDVRHGVGTFAAENVLQVNVELSPSDWMVERDRSAAAFARAGISAVEDVRSLRAAEPEGEAADELGAVPALRIETVHTFGGTAAMRSLYWLVPTGPVQHALARLQQVRDDEEAFGRAELTQLVGGDLFYAWRSFDAVAATRGDTTALGVAVGAPLLRRCGVNVDSSGVPRVHVERRCRSDRMRFVLRTRPDGGGSARLPQ